ncbi:hypothetical protein KQI42_20385 [Tissierella sp. MSJ-40]|uniref:Uncharacterized protein n=1 Tax=Tissierella simiarum TaxID=2841534 RepID=A0ABS6EBR1_9FIRM|nr:hypothetical protein [Tissierella simiarum]MBU5440358.1 hypothetical protein [Tissierella simiarum]
MEGCGKLDLILELNLEQKEVINSIYNISMDKIKIVGGGYDGDIFNRIEKYF